MNGQLPVMIATNAFGLGIDQPDLRCVLDAQMPDRERTFLRSYAGRIAPRVAIAGIAA